MKKIALAAAIGFAASTAFAGNPTGPTIEPPLMPPMDVETATGSSSGAGRIVPLILLALVAAALAD